MSLSQYTIGHLQNELDEATVNVTNVVKIGHKRNAPSHQSELVEQKMAITIWQT